MKAGGLIVVGIILAIAFYISRKPEQPKFPTPRQVKGKVYVW